MKRRFTKPRKKQPYRKKRETPDTKGCKKKEKQPTISCNSPSHHFLKRTTTRVELFSFLTNFFAHRRPFLFPSPPPAAATQTHNTPDNNTKKSKEPLHLTSLFSFFFYKTSPFHFLFVLIYFLSPSFFSSFFSSFLSVLLELADGADGLLPILGSRISLIFSSGWPLINEATLAQPRCSSDLMSM